ncbi:MAG: hypothetical protein ABFD54_16240 [Armatimonadota bacterium]|nr:hypothetical protein [bacterium]
MKRLFTFALVVVMIAGALSCVFGDPVLLEYKFTKGELDKYRFAMNMNMQPAEGMGISAMNMSTSMVMKQKTIDVLPDGSGVIQLTISDIKLSGPIAQGNSIPSQTVKMTVSKNGKLISIDSSGVNTGMPMDMSSLMNQTGQQAELPSSPINIGDTWKSTIPMPFGGGSLTVLSTLIANGEKVWSQDAARIRQEFAGSMNLGQMLKGMTGALPGVQAETLSGMAGSVDLTGSSELTFATSMGKMLKANNKTNAVIKIALPASAVQNGAPSSIDMTMNMTMTVTRFK